MAIVPSEMQTASRTTGREIGKATLLYTAVLVLLFHRLLIGEVLSPAANQSSYTPFWTPESQQLVRYRNDIQGDVWRQVDPWAYYQYDSARHGRFPLWNPHIFCGFGFHSNNM